MGERVGWLGRTGQRAGEAGDQLWRATEAVGVQPEERGGFVGLLPATKTPLGSPHLASSGCHARHCLCVVPHPPTMLMVMSGT